MLYMILSFRSRLCASLRDAIGAFTHPPVARVFVVIAASANLLLRSTASDQNEVLVRPSKPIAKAGQIWLRVHGDATQIK